MTQNPPYFHPLVSPMQPEDVLAFPHQNEPQTMQLSRQEIYDEGYSRWLIQSGPAFTARTADGQILGCMGVSELWDGRGAAWAILSALVGPHLRFLTLESRRFFSTCEFRRVEAYVDASFPQGQRWCSLLGFKRETPEPMANFYDNGNAAYLYAMVRGH
jgi:hypothetical protein